MLGDAGTLSADKGGGCGAGPTGPDSGSSLSRVTEKRRGEMFRFATLFVTYCWIVLKKLMAMRPSGGGDARTAFK